MNIYNSNENNFENNGIGFLNNCIKAEVTESLNGDYILNLEYPLNDRMSDYLIEENIIKTKVVDGSYQLFRIKKVTKSYSTINVYAMHITYDLLNNMLLDVYPTNLNCQNFGRWILDNTNFSTPFQFESDIGITKSARYVRKNPIEAIMGDIDNSMVNIFGGELERDNFTIKMLAQRGRNNHVKLLYGKNITELLMTIDITEMYTRIIPQGFDGLLLPEKYYDSPIIDNYLTPKCGVIEFPNIKYDETGEDEEAYDNIEDAYEALRNAVRELYKNGIDKPIINIKVNWLELSKTTQYYNQYKNLESIQLGDIITAEILGIDYTTRVTKIVYNVLTDSIDKFEIGTITKTIANTLNSQNASIKKINPSSILQSAKESATNLITNAMGGYVYKTNEELYIMDNNDPALANKVWRWNINGLGYSSAGINGPYGLAMTMDGKIVADYITTGKLNTSVIEGYDSLSFTVKSNSDAIGDRTGKLTTITQDISNIEAQISDVADITTSDKSDFAYVELDNINASEPIHIDIHPIIDNIAYIYPSNNTIIGNSLKLQSRKLIFYNYTTNSIEQEYTIPIDLYWYDENIYDEFHLDYDSYQCYAIKRCKLQDGLVVLQEPERIDFEYPTIPLSGGNYKIYLKAKNSGYIFARLMVVNAYTAQYATKVELSSSIKQTSDSIKQTVSSEIERVNGNIENVRGEVELKIGRDENNQIVSMLNASADEINLQGNRFVLNSSNFKVSKDGTIEAKNGKFNGEINSTTGNIGGWAIQNGQLTNGVAVINNNGYATIYTPADMICLQQIIRGAAQMPDANSKIFKHYDLNNDGVLNAADLLRLAKLIGFDE